MVLIIAVVAFIVVVKLFFNAVGFIGVLLVIIACSSYMVLTDVDEDDIKSAMTDYALKCTSKSLLTNDKKGKKFPYLSDDDMLEIMDKELSLMHLRTGQGNISDVFNLLPAVIYSAMQNSSIEKVIEKLEAQAVVAKLEDKADDCEIGSTKKTNKEPRLAGKSSQYEPISSNNLTEISAMVGSNKQEPRSAENGTQVPEYRTASDSTEKTESKVAVAPTPEPELSMNEGEAETDDTPVPETPPLANGYADSAVQSVPSTPLVPTPTAVPVECSEAKQCLALSLIAATHEDMEAVRAIAIRFDSLNKPAQGNRAVSRKLNSDGLDAMKRNDFNAATDFFRKGFSENPRDVEIAANLGFALVKSEQIGNSIDVLTRALLLDPRRTSTWTPLAEALVLNGRKEEALAALWIGYQWSSNRDKSIAFYATRAENERDIHPSVSEMYKSVSDWVTGIQRPPFGGLAVAH